MSSRAKNNRSRLLGIYSHGTRQLVDLDTNRTNLDLKVGYRFAACFAELNVRLQFLLGRCFVGWGA